MGKKKVHSETKCLCIGRMKAGRRQKSRLISYCITFLGEKILGIFASQYEFAGDTPQQLNDQRYVICNAEPQPQTVARGEGKTRQGDRYMRRCPGHRPTPRLWRRAEEDGAGKAGMLRRIQPTQTSAIHQFTVTSTR